MRQTNPISRDARDGLPPRALRGPVVQTNPIPLGRDGARRTNRPNLPPPDKQAGPSPDPIVRNKPNFAGRPSPWSSKYAKRTQFRPLRPSTAPITAILHHSTIPTPRRLCQTKPNLGTLGYLGSRTRDAGQMRQTKPIPDSGWDRSTKRAKQTQFAAQ
jgi:hypothetical protein